MSHLTLIKNVDLRLYEEFLDEVIEPSTSLGG